MGDLLLLVHGLMKLALVIGLIVLVGTAPSVGAATGDQSSGFTSERDIANGDKKMEIDHDAPSQARTRLDGWTNWADSEDSSPAFNLDGTPMNGDFDIHGHAYGDCGCDFDN